MSFYTLFLISSMICILSLIPTYAETSNYSVSGSFHDYQIKLLFSDGMVKGNIIHNDEIISLDNSKLIERKSGFLIIDKENDLKIISKKISNDKQIVIVKIKPDTKLRFIVTIDSIKKNIGQRDLFSAMEQKQDKSNLSFKELEYKKKNNLTNKAQQQYEKKLENMIMCNSDNTLKCLSRDKIFADFENHKIKTGMDLMVKEKIIKPKITVIDNRELYVLTSHYDKVSNNQNEVFRFAVKTFDKNVYSGTEWDKFDGKLDGVSINVKIKDNDGNVKKEFSGVTKYGLFEGETKIESKLTYPQGNYSLELDVTFKNQKFSDTLYFMIYEDSIMFNNRPITNAGDDGHYTSGYTVQLSGSNSTDQDDVTLFYTWNQLSGSSVILSDKKIVNPVFIVPDIFDSFVFELMVDDGRKKSNTSDIVTITSLHSDAGADRILINGTDVTINSTNIILDGSLSGDVLHNFIFDWSILNYPTDSTVRTGNLTDNTIFNPEFMPDQLGDYELQLIITDDVGLTDIDQVTITVNP